MNKLDVKIGDKYNYLTILKEVSVGVRPSGQHYRRFLCQCDCGKKKIIGLSDIRSGSTISCGCMKGGFEDLTMQRFGRLVALRREENYPNKQTAWLCKCDCGNLKIVRSASLKNGTTKSCGCILNDRALESPKGERLYAIWRGIRIRTLKHSSKSEYYYDRGIKMCDEWKESFESFKEWSLKNGYNDTLSIDRIDNNGDYCPENCRWTTAKVQANNRNTCVYITFENETLSFSQWCDKLGFRADSVGRYVRKHKVSHKEGLEHFMKLKNVKYGF